MIAVDTSSWIAFFSDRDPPCDDTTLVESALADHQACLPPVVVTELLGDPRLPDTVATLTPSSPSWTWRRAFGSERGCCEPS